MPNYNVINSYLPFSFFHFSMTTLLQLGVYPRSRYSSTLPERFERLVNVGFYGGRKTGEPGEKPSEYGRESPNVTHAYMTARGKWGGGGERAKGCTPLATAPSSAPRRSRREDCKESPSFPQILYTSRKLLTTKNFVFILRLVFFSKESFFSC